MTGVGKKINMDKITVGVLTVSDRCSKNTAIDESGPNLKSLIGEGLVKNGTVVNVDLVPDNQEQIKRKLTEWSDAGVDVILTTGGTGLSERDVTPEATLEVCDKIVPGISWQMMQRSLAKTPLASLSRSVAGFRRKTLIINLPGSKKASQECLEAVAEVIPHAVDLIAERKSEIQRVHGSFHGKKSSVKTDNVAGRKRESPYPMISVKEAQKIIMERVFLLRKEKVIRYEMAHDHVLAQDLVARENHPPFDASLKDGYAVLSIDEEADKIVMGPSNAGVPPSQSRVLAGHCVRVSTGAVVPPGADAVVPVEDTELILCDGPNEESKIKVLSRPKRGQDIRPKGSDFKMGEMLLTTGTYLNPAAMGLLATAGIVNVRVFEKPLVAVISTGDELLNPDEEPKPGKVRDSNRITLLSLLGEENMPRLDYGIVRDDPDDLRTVLERAFQKADVIVTTGSMSMGERDYLKEILEVDFGAEICFGRIHMKPGKPTAFGILEYDGKPKLWFGLPGNPASALVTSHLLLLPALRRISGRQEVFPIEVVAELDQMPVLEDRPQYARGILKYDEIGNTWMAQIIRNQRSSWIGSCVNSNCLLELPHIFVSLGQKADSSLPKGVFGGNTNNKRSDPFNFSTMQGLAGGSSFGGHKSFMAPDPPLSNFGSQPPEKAPSQGQIPGKRVRAFLIGKTLRA